MTPRATTVILAVLWSVAPGARAADAWRVADPPRIDGDPADAAWDAAEWQAIDKPLIGGLPQRGDFSGRFKVAWSPDYLYVLAQITDDALVDTHPDPLDNYWNDDALEIFIDEDASGGLHLNDYNAFAYHIALDNQVVDIAPSATHPTGGAPALFNDHVMARWRRDPSAPHNLFWEARIRVYGENAAPDGIPERLLPGKVIGFMIAWCDADDSSGRKGLIGNIDIDPADGDRNRGYIDAGVFGRLRLLEKPD